MRISSVDSGKNPTNREIAILKKEFGDALKKSILLAILSGGLCLTAIATISIDLPHVSFGLYGAGLVSWGGSFYCATRIQAVKDKAVEMFPCASYRVYTDPLQWLQGMLDAKLRGPKSVELMPLKAAS